ncbi:hypothetical protein [Microbacterium gorillae]|uniref:hypothetical protein n=1 Tax=Microbacterium gorillae TaxID=1231063 RepID=UPI000693C2D1|nr:hypothetical protein [Microbacterium gorillae]
MNITLARLVRTLAWTYVGLSIATVLALIVLSLLAPADVTIPAWVRGVIVALTSLLTLRFAIAAARHGGRALLRLRIIAPILLIAVVAVLFFLPLPLWMVIEQALCGVVLAALTVAAYFPAAASPQAA